MKTNIIFGCFLGILATFSGAMGGDTPFSQYGMVQNVQNYSSNPFWSPNGSYNQRMPTPVYAMGPDVDSADCQRVISALVTAQCSVRDNCRTTQLSDIRPAIIVTLSRMPGANYAAACSGYIDTIYEQYVRQTGYAVPIGQVPFPTPTAPNPDYVAPDNGVPSMMPYIAPTPDWMRDMQEREQQLQELQAQNGATGVEVYKAEFPTTFSDLSFSEQLEIETQGFAPFQGVSAYSEIDLESKEDYDRRTHDIIMARDLKNLPRTEFCQKYPTHNLCRPTGGNGGGSSGDGSSGGGSSGGGSSGGDDQYVDGGDKNDEGVTVFYL